MTTIPPATGRTYAPQVIAAWLHGYATGEGVAHTLGMPDAWKEGYDAGYLAGIAAGRRLADHDAAERFRAYRAMSDAIRPNLARPRPHGAAKPLPTPAECLESWPATTPALRSAA